MVGDCPTIMEIDLVRSTYSVAHCGESAAGQFLNTLTCTDICTGWTEPIALRRRSQETVCFVIDAMQKGLPFDLLGIDSDNGSRLRYHNGSRLRYHNGSEFTLAPDASAGVNDLLYAQHLLGRYCLDKKITFTRSRPYKKNDQAHACTCAGTSVEQKNWSIVRRTIGYDRMESDEEHELCATPTRLESIYRVGLRQRLTPLW